MAGTLHSGPPGHKDVSLSRERGAVAGSNAGRKGEIIAKRTSRRSEVMGLLRKLRHTPGVRVGLIRSGSRIEVWGPKGMILMHTTPSDHRWPQQIKYTLKTIGVEL